MARRKSHSRLLRWAIWASAALSTALPASATLEDQIEAAPFRGICAMTQACNPDGSCGFIPAIGSLLLVTTPQGTMMGRSDDDLDPIDLFQTLADADPLPELDGQRREFLVQHGIEARQRRFALYVQMRSGGTVENSLARRHFILECTETPQ